MPALSCPRCCSAYRPEVGQLGCFRVAVDGDHAALLVEFIEHSLRCGPHCDSSGVRVAGLQSRISQEPSVMVALPDLDALLNCNADHRGLDPVLLGDGRHLLGMRRGNQNARRSFVKRQHLGPQVGIEIDLRADLGRAEAALGQRHRQPAIAQIVRRFRPGPRRQSRGWPPARASRSPYRARAAGPKAASRFPWRTACRRSAHRRTRRRRPAGSRCGRRS